MIQEQILRLARRFLGPIHRSLVVRGPVSLGDDIHIGPGSRVECWRGLEIGNDVYIGKNCSVVVDGSIGSNVLIASNVGLVGRHDHDHREVGTGIRRASWIGDVGYDGPGITERLVIDDDVWIGFGSVVLSGVTVGRGAIVAAGSVVINDVEPYAIMAGNPATAISRRFSPAEIVAHEEDLYGEVKTQVRSDLSSPAEIGLAQHSSCSLAPSDVPVQVEVAGRCEGDADDLDTDRSARKI